MLQALADPRAAEYMKGRKVMEINPDHPIVKSLNENFESDASNAAVSALPNLPPLSYPLASMFLPCSIAPSHNFVTYAAHGLLDLPGEGGLPN